MAVAGLSGAAAVSSGVFHTCAILTDRSVRCWGANTDGELGNGTTTASATPVTVTGISNAVGITAGNAGPDGFSCAVLMDGTVKCWGYGPRLGTGGTANSPTPETVSGIAGATMVSARNDHACALIQDGSVNAGDLTGTASSETARPRIRWCRCGQSGSPTPSLSPLVMAAPAWPRKVEASAVGGSGRLALRWRLPQIPGVSGVVAVSAGLGESCALLSGGTAICWGANTFGQLGIGTTTSPATPTPVIAPQ